MYSSYIKVLIPPNLKVSGVILSDHIKSLDWKMRKAEYCDKVYN